MDKLEEMLSGNYPLAVAEAGRRIYRLERIENEIRQLIVDLDANKSDQTTAGLVIGKLSRILEGKP